MTKIEWTQRPGTKGETWNPIVGCSIVSKGCTNCYAMRAAHRLEHALKVPQYQGTTRKVNGNPVWTGKVNFVPAVFEKPLHWRKPRTIFVNSMSDLFHEDVPDDWIDRVFAIAASCPQHTFIVFTKRSTRMRGYLTKDSVDHAGQPMQSPGMGARDAIRTAMVRLGLYDKDLGAWPLPNVWLVVSTEDQRAADEHIPNLLATPAAVRGISCEPLLGAVDVAQWLRRHFQAVGVDRRYGEAETVMHPRPALDWVIAGDESGPGARPCNHDWHRGLRDQCVRAGVPFFLKQHADNGRKIPTPELDGRRWTEWPA